MPSGILNKKGIIFYKEEGLRIYFRDGFLMKRESGKADEDIAIGKDTKFSWVINKANEWIKDFESCTS